MNNNAFYKSDLYHPGDLLEVVFYENYEKTGNNIYINLHSHSVFVWKGVRKIESTQLKSGDKVFVLEAVEGKNVTIDKMVYETFFEMKLLYNNQIWYSTISPDYFKKLNNINNNE